MTSTSDEALVLASRDGDRQAFAELVDRYRNLVVGVAYNRVGDFGRSEDIAQQAFITAWKRNFDLKTPSNFVAWLCGITRNLVRNERRRIAREPKEVVDETTVTVSTDSPAQQAIAREESELLWSVLERIPETYREPMILYYRKDASTAEISAALDISPELVRQRLARGRKLLEENIATFVESQLSNRNTSQDFVASVMMALPGGAATKSLGMLATIGLNLWIGVWTFLGPLIGIAGGVYGAKRSLDRASSREERRFVWRLIAVVSLLSVTVLAAQFGLNVWAKNSNSRELIQGSMWVLYSLLLSVTITIANRYYRNIKRKHGTEDEKNVMRSEDARPISPRAMAWNLVAASTGSISWMFVVAGYQRDWIGLLAVMVLLICVLGGFVPRIVRAKTVDERLLVNWQAIIVTLLGAVAIAATRWSKW